MLESIVLISYRFFKEGVCGNGKGFSEKRYFFWKMFFLITRAGTIKIPTIDIKRVFFFCNDNDYFSKNVFHFISKNILILSQLPSIIYKLAPLQNHQKSQKLRHFDLF